MINEPRLDRAIDIVFVSEGYTRGALPAYRQRARRLIAEVEGDRGGFVAQARRLFNYHRIDLPSASGDLENRDRLDTPLRGCIAPGDRPNDAREFFRVQYERAEFATRQNTKDADVVVVLVNSEWADASASVRASPLLAQRGGVVLLGRSDDGRMLTHELGHALFGLGDEYVVAKTECYRASAEERDFDLLAPNLSLDEQGSKWRHLVRGAREGGDQYGKCVYRPTDSCRMSDHRSPRFCVVCSAAINRELAARLTGDDGAPRLMLSATRDPARGETVTALQAIDFTPPLRCALTADGKMVRSYSVSKFGWIRARERHPRALSVTLTCADRTGRRSTTSATVR